MTGAELSAIRKRLRLSPADFGIALGLKGSRDNISRSIRRLEKDKLSINEATATQAHALMARAGGQGSEH
jgi:hypothetical protein